MRAQLVFHSAFASLLSLAFLAVVFVADSPAAETTPNNHVATPPDTVVLQELTSPEVAKRLDTGITTIIIPTGGTEQNGPHMVLGKHNMIVAETARRIARELGNALTAPVLAYVPEGSPAHKSGHMAYPGTISLPDDIFEAVLENAALSFKTHGFTRIVFVGDSGGNQRPQERVAARLDKEWSVAGIRVMSAGDYYAQNGGDEFLQSQGLTSSQIGTHAGVRDTSELIAIAPGAVRLQSASEGAPGTTGDARLARASWGKELIDQKVAAAVAEIRAFEKAATEKAVHRPETAGVFGWILSLFTG